MAANCGLSLALDPMGNSCKIHLQNCSTNETKLCRNAHYGRLHRNLEENTNIIQLQSFTLYVVLKTDNASFSFITFSSDIFILPTKKIKKIESLPF
jgi:hypothetical protein